MTCRLLSLSSEAMWPELLRLLENRDNPDQTVETDVRAMLDAVRKGGDSAVLEYVRRFDCPDMRPPLRVPAEDLEQAARDIPAESLDCIKQAADNIRAFHEAQKDRSWFLTRDDGTILGQKIEAVDRAGLYVPGGRGGNTPLISSLLMTAIPAQAAGVREIAVVTPPRADGTLNPHILAAAHLLGVHEIYRMGGAWAIAALAYGTETVAPVDVIAGPGNIWVTTAKRLVQGRVGIDMIAGPSEVLVLADDSANPEWLAADMLSQAEHDALASAICITDNEALAHAVIAELERQSATLPRADIVRKSLADWSAVVLVPDMDAAAVMDDAGNVTIFAVNRDLTEPMVLDLDLRSFGDLRPAMHSVLHHDDMKAENTESAPDVVKPVILPCPKPGEPLVLPAASWNVIRFVK